VTAPPLPPDCVTPADCFNGFSLTAIWSSFIQSEGTKQGSFFDPDTLEPLVNNSAMARAMDIFVRLAAFGPPDEASMPCLPFNIKFVLGRCALTLSWGYQLKANLFLNISRVRENVSVALLPGSTQVGGGVGEAGWVGGCTMGVDGWVDAPRGFTGEARRPWKCARRGVARPGARHTHPCGPR
jgi:hypothetical protein